MQLTVVTATTKRDLTTLDFSQDERQRLEALNANYDPYREYCESNREYEQICFLKWRYERGAVREATTG